jgi:hypothetical protein
MIREPASPKIVSLRLSLLGRRWGLRRFIRTAKEGPKKPHQNPMSLSLWIVLPAPL